MSERTHGSSEDDGTGELPSDDLLAGEYVLGVLDAEQRRTIRTRIEAEPMFARQISEWEQRLAPMTLSIEPVDVPAYLWPQLCARLGWGASEPNRTESDRTDLWRNLAFWRAATTLAAVIAIAALAVLLPRILAPGSYRAAVRGVAEPVTTLTHDNGTPAWLAFVNARRGTLLLVPVPSAPDSRGRGRGRVPELWLIAPGQAPRPLGVLSNQRTQPVVVPANLRTALTSSGAVLAVSLEPAGGAPHGAPTGPIIAKGTIQL